MNAQLMASVEREVLAWPGVNKEVFEGGRGQGGFLVPPATLFRFGRREIGHLHHTGEADLPFPRKVYDELIATGRTQPDSPESSPTSSANWTMYQELSSCSA